MRGPKDELVGAFVIEVDEAGVGLERGRDLARDQGKHLVEVERRIDSLDRLRQEPEVPFSRVHVTDYCPGHVSKYDWLLFLHITGAFLLAGGTWSQGC